MVEFINRLTGSIMEVADEREAEYLSLGHEPVKKKEAPRKRASKKGAKTCTEVQRK